MNLKEKINLFEQKEKENEKMIEKIKNSEFENDNELTLKNKIIYLKKELIEENEKFNLAKKLIKKAKNFDVCKKYKNDILNLLLNNNNNDIYLELKEMFDNLSNENSIEYNNFNIEEN